MHIKPIRQVGKKGEIIMSTNGYVNRYMCNMMCCGRVVFMNTA